MLRKTSTTHDNVFYDDDNDDNEDDNDDNDNDSDDNDDNAIKHTFVNCFCCFFWGRPNTISGFNSG